MPIRVRTGKILDPWQIAIHTHLASLSDAQRANFQAIASPEDCLQLITNSRRVRGSSKLLNLLRPVIEPLKRFEHVVDVLVQTNAGIGSPIWGPLKLAIMVFRLF